jgi:hypothetical protein
VFVGHGGILPERATRGEDRQSGSLQAGDKIEAILCDKRLDPFELEH